MRSDKPAEAIAAIDAAIDGESEAGELAAWLHQV